MITLTDLAKNIRLARESCDITQEELASRIGLSRVMVTRYENGTKSPTVAMLAQLADALYTSADKLLGRV